MYFVGFRCGNGDERGVSRSHAKWCGRKHNLDSLDVVLDDHRIDLATVDSRRDFFRMMNKKETAAKMSRSTASPPVLQGSRTDLLILAAVCTSGGGYSRRERFSAYQTRMLVSKMMFDRNLPSAGPNHNPTEHRSQGTFEDLPIIVSSWIDWWRCSRPAHLGGCVYFWVCVLR